MFIVNFLCVPKKPLIRRVKRKKLVSFVFVDEKKNKRRVKIFYNITDKNKQNEQQTTLQCR